jgi:pyruvate, water dikinase
LGRFLVIFINEVDKKGASTMMIGNLFKYWTYRLFSPGTVLKEKYAAFKSLLTHDKRSHELMAELEDIYYNQKKRDFSAIVRLCTDLSRHVSKIVDDISRVCPESYPDLLFFYKKIDGYIRYMTTPDGGSTTRPYVLKLEDTAIDDLHLVGGKALNLGIVKNILQLPVPDGFSITTNAYRHFIHHNNLRARIDDQLSAININDTRSLDTISQTIKTLIMTAEVPGDLKTAIGEHHQAIVGKKHINTGVAMRSSAVGEDAKASFAGQYTTVLNVKKKGLWETYKTIIAGKYSPEAIYYRINYGLPDDHTPMAVLVLNMIDAVSSGVMYTTDIIGEPKNDTMKIHAIWGLGELLVSGQTPADILTLSKKPSPGIVARRSAAKTHQMVYKNKGQTESTPLHASKKQALSLDDPTAIQLSEWGMALERYFRQPQDIEWSMDPEGNPYILQSRPLHTHTFKADERTCNFEDIQQEILLQGGECAASGIAAGKIYNIEQGQTLEAVPENAVLVARNASPQYVKVINRLSAVITDAGSAAGHFASVAREFGVPALVNTGNASTRLNHNQPVTVHADGQTVYAETVTQMLDSPCAKTDLLIDSPFMQKLHAIMTFVSPLELVNPDAKTFSPIYCKSFHDIIRFAHETTIQEMFHISDNRLIKLNFAKKLATDIPLQFYILDVGEGLRDHPKTQKEVHIDTVRNRAMRALWSGLTHPGIEWGAFSHFDWEAHDRIVMSGGIASPKSTMFSSHAVISNDYMNLNFRFGYHFVIVDALCTSNPSENAILFRFSGGGADLSHRMLRADFLNKILIRLGFDVTVKSDLVDGQFKGADLDTSLQKLDMLGRLLGATRLMDMYLKDASMIDGFVDDFMQGRYHFASVDID